MENFLKIALPIAISDLRLSDLDISENMGFINAYIIDENRLWYRDLIYLQYRSDVNTAAAKERDNRFMRESKFFDKKKYIISGVSYTVYAFRVYDKAIYKVYEGIVPYQNDKYLKIHKFWNFTDGFINELLCNRATMITDDLVIDEEKSEFMSIRFKYASLPASDKPE